MLLKLFANQVIRSRLVVAFGVIWMNAFIWIEPLSKLSYAGLLSLMGFIIAFIGVMDSLGRFQKHNDKG